MSAGQDGPPIGHTPQPPFPGTPGPPPPGGPVPPRPKRPPVPRLAVVAGAAVLLIGGVAGAVLLVGGDDGKGRKPGTAAPSAWAQEAGRQISTKPGMSYEGTIMAAGKPVQVRLKVSREGAASGTLTAGPLQAELVTAGGATYVKAGQEFWRGYGGETARPANYAGRWTKAPAALLGVDVRDVLGPEAIAKLLAKGPAKPPKENIAGTPAYRVKTARADYLLTVSAPYKLLSVQTAGNGDPKFTVTELTDAAPLFAEIRPRVAGLGGAVDPALRFAPGKLTFINCNDNTNGCTVSVPASLTAPQDAVPADARAALRATVTSKGMMLGQCRGSGPVPANRSVVLRCTVAGKAWRNWMKRALDAPGQHPYQASALVLGEAVAPGEVAGLLAKIDKERGPQPLAGSSVPASVPTSARP